jgi:arylsulfatase A-like enzyme
MEAEARKRPNVIYILSDEHAGMAMSHTGDPNVRTPTMDRIAAEGVSFERAYSNCPVCTPSRGTIFSGRHAHAGPVQGFFDVYKPTAPSTASILREAGYHTAYMGKWHCGVVHNQIPPTVEKHPGDYSRWPQRTPEYLRAGFQDWYGFEINNAPFKGFYYHEHEVDPRQMDKYQTDYLTDLTIDYLREYDRDEPLFCVLSVEPPHFPLEAPEEYCRFDPNELELRPNFTGNNWSREQVAVYYAMVENLDANIQRLLDAIEETDRFNRDTVVVYTSDHGDFMGSHQSLPMKVHPQEESVRIPAIFHGPESSQPGDPWHIPETGLRDEMFSLVDLLPTTLGLLGLDVPVHVQGRDFSPALRGESFVAPDDVLLEMQGVPRWGMDNTDWRGFVSERWKYAFYETGHEVLYDLENDPYEMHDVASEQPETCAGMRKRLLELLRETREPYFDVLIEHGAPLACPTYDIGSDERVGQHPAWKDTIIKRRTP